MGDGPRTLVIIPDKCVGCGTCKLACSMVKASGDAMRRTRIHIHNISRERYVQMTCLQCVDAACIKACDTGALMRNEATGAVELQENRCISCGLCEVACPFGHMHFNRATGKPEKCDLCSGDPACAKFCPHGALLYR